MPSLTKYTSHLQLLGAALALPSGLAGAYSVYHTYFSAEVVCQNLRNTALTTMEKKIPRDAKHGFLQKDVKAFEASCGGTDPDSSAIFEVALQELEKPARHNQPSAPAQGAFAAAGPGPSPTPPAVSAPASVAAAPTGLAPGPRVARQPAPAATSTVASAGMYPAGQRTEIAGASVVPTAATGSDLVTERSIHGWVALERKDTVGKLHETYFSGYAAGQSPTPGTVLTAKVLRPIWAEPQGAGFVDPQKIQGRISAGECVRVLATKQSPSRQWAEVDPVACR